MSHSIFKVPFPKNETILEYAPVSPEKEDVLKMYRND